MPTYRPPGTSPFQQALQRPRRVGVGFQSSGIGTNGVFGSPLMLGSGPQQQPVTRDLSPAPLPVFRQSIQPRQDELAKAQAAYDALKASDEFNSDQLDAALDAIERAGGKVSRGTFGGGSVQDPDGQIDLITSQAQPAVGSDEWKRRSDLFAAAQRRTVQRNKGNTALGDVDQMFAPGPTQPAAGEVARQPGTLGPFRIAELEQRKALAQQQGIARGQAREARLGAFSRGGIGDGDGPDPFEMYAMQTAIHGSDPDIAAKAGRMATDLRLGRMSARNSLAEIKGRQGVAETAAGASKYAADQERIAKELDAQGRREEATQVREAADRRHAEVMGGQNVERKEGRQRFGLTFQQMKDAATQRQQQFAAEQAQRGQQFDLTRQQQFDESTRGTQQHQERMAAEERQHKERMGKDIVPEEDKLYKTTTDILATNPEMGLNSALQQAKKLRQDLKGNGSSAPVIGKTNPYRSSQVGSQIDAIMTRPELTPDQQKKLLIDSGVTEDEIREWARTNASIMPEGFHWFMKSGPSGTAWKTDYETGKRKRQFAGQFMAP